jgi:prefoldin subunit 5
MIEEADILIESTPPEDLIASLQGQIAELNQRIATMETAFDALWRAFSMLASDVRRIERKGGWAR